MHAHIASLKKKLYFFVAAYFRFWANLSLKRWKPTVIAVTGSVGKTTMLHLLELQLGERAHYSHFANSAFGISFDIVGTRGVGASKWRWFKLVVIVPLRALTFTHTQPYYVVEIDGERPHEAEFLASWLKPTYTLWVSSGRSHAIYFDSQVRKGKFTTVEEAIAYEFASLARHTTNTVYVDGENELMQQQVAKITARVVPVIKSDLKMYQVTPASSLFEFVGGTFTVPYPLPKETYVQLSMLELICTELDIKINYSLDNFVMPPGRSSYLQGKNDINIIDSTYNAHLVSMQSMFTMMHEMRVEGKKWLVIGDMTDQGEGEADQHTKLGEAMASVPADRYVLVGRRTARYTKPALEAAGMGELTVSFTSTRAALEYIESHNEGGETMLFKGSQYLEWVVEKLLKTPDDRNKLARQDEAARQRRAKWGLE
ncbi:hypothetical protein FJZ39_04300 [Candidatus Saccharibacteria bacterium]|nr:hypothetical protein [Candidatus Saccharibacteria bacterium]